MGIFNKILKSGPSAKEVIMEMISEQEQEALKYKEGSPLSRRSKEKIALLEELASRLNISLYG